MFKQNKIINSGKAELSNFIDGQDIFNSQLLEEMHQPGLDKVLHTISTDYRPDQVAKEFYGSTDYLGILLMQVSPSLEYFRKGEVIKLLPKSTIDTIITKL